jgi:soluble lytic murein transglycosylase
VTTKRTDRLVVIAVAAIVVVLVALLALGIARRGRAGALPLTNVSVIREQATAKHLDPALVAAVIYAESRFEPRPSPAGAQGLMQILPATAYYLARLSGGTAFNAGDLATPRVNVAYGSYYLRYLLNHYRGDETLALAAYNGGLSNVDYWRARAGEEGRTLTAQSIPFPETRDYVEKVLEVQQQYRSQYPQALGLE